METAVMQFNYLELELPIENILDIAQSGDNSEAVEEVLKLKMVQEQIKLLDKEKIVKCLEDYGAWDDEELSNHDENIKRLIWIGSWNYFDEN